MLSSTDVTVSGQPLSFWARIWAHRTLRENLVGYSFMIPWLIGFFTFTVGPILASGYLSLTRYDLLTPPRWTGLDNYERLLTRDTRFMHSLEVTITYVAFDVPLKLAFALLVAIILNRGLRGLSLYRGIYYLPSLLGGSVAIAVMWRQVFGLDGFVNDITGVFGIAPKSYVASPDTALLTLIILSVWQFGSPMVIFLAGLKQIPAELYEAAEIDGAGGSKKFLRITLPLLTPIIFFNLVMQTIGAFQSFTPAFIISGGRGGPADSTLFYSLYLYQQGFQYLRMGYATAMAWILLAIIATLTAVNFLAARFWVFYDSE